jgi:hypothetical protein
VQDRLVRPQSGEVHHEADPLDVVVVEALDVGGQPRKLQEPAPLISTLVTRRNYERDGGQRIGVCTHPGATAIVSLSGCA